MTKILHVASSSNLTSSYSRQAGTTLLDELKVVHPDATVIERDLVTDPLPHVGPDFVGSIRLPDTNIPALALSNRMVDELLGSDIIIIESPMYNFSIPSTLKAWIDHIARAGRTFRYGANGPEGLVTDKKVFLVLASGGVYSDGPYKAYEHQESYLRAVLGFLGMTNIETIRVEGVMAGPEAAAGILEAAKEKAVAVAHETA